MWGRTDVGRGRKDEVEFVAPGLDRCQLWHKKETPKAHIVCKMLDLLLPQDAFGIEVACTLSRKASESGANVAKVQ